MVGYGVNGCLDIRCCNQCFTVNMFINGWLSMGR